MAAVASRGGDRNKKTNTPRGSAARWQYYRLLPMLPCRDSSISRSLPVNPPPNPSAEGSREATLSRQAVLSAGRRFPAALFVRPGVSPTLRACTVNCTLPGGKIFRQPANFFYCRRLPRPFPTPPLHPVGVYPTPPPSTWSQNTEDQDLQDGRMSRIEEGTWVGLRYGLVTKGEKG